MWKMIAAGAAGGAAVLGVGTAALASSGDITSGTVGTSTSVSAVAPADPTGRTLDRADVLKRLGNVAHGSWVSKDGAGDYVTHSAIHGSVTAVSATSITVKAGDGTSLTYAVDDKTMVRVRSNGKGTAGTITDVKPGQNAVVLGTGTSTLTATVVVTGLSK